MKGINLKKIGAIVAGSAILASSVAFAGLVYQNTPLVDANGQPVVKIVVGERAAASDGVVAAYIASKIANEAYKSSTLTAEVVGAGTCTGASGTGTCSVVAGSEKVTLLVTVPGAGAADRVDYEAGIGDYLDRELQNRFKTNGVTDADEEYTIYDDYSDTEGNPYQDYIGYVVDTDFDSIEYSAMVRVGPEFGPFAPVTVQPKGASSPTQEGQFFTFAGKNYWDDSDSMLKNQLTEGGYTVVFGVNGDYGLPLCPGDPGRNLDLCADTDELPSKKVFIKFLGEDWIISEVTPADVSFAVQDQQTYHTHGSKIKLAKEAVSGIINVGEFLDAGNGYKVRLDDISREVGVGNDHPAIITVLDSNDNEVCQDQVWPGDTEDNLCDTTGIKLHVYQTAPGVMLIAKWAEMGIFSDEIELEDGKEFIDESDSAWEVLIGWENKGTGDMSDLPEYFRTIQLWTEDYEDMDEMEPGDVFPVLDLPDYEAFDLTYNGIDDSDADYDDLKMKVEASTDKKVAIRDGPLSTDTCNIVFGPSWGGTEYIKVTSSKGEFRSVDFDAFLSTQRRGSEMYWLPYGYSTDGTDPNTCGFGGPVGSVVLKDNDGDYWLFDPSFTPVNYESFQYRWAGSNGELAFGTGAGGPPAYTMFYAEDVGKVKEDNIGPMTTWTAINSLGWTYEECGNNELDSFYSDMFADCSGNPDEDVWLMVTDDQNNWYDLSYYTSTLGYTSFDDYSPGFVTMRGTKYTGTSGQKTLKVPKSILKATYTFATAVAATAEPDQTTLVLGEGDEATIGTSGVKIKVLNITESLTPCTFGTGAGAAPTCDMSGVSAVIMPNNAPSVAAKEVFPVTSNMVVLDRDATALETGTVITIGGDAVNTVTASAIAGSGVDFAAQPVVVRAIGNKIVVAGLTSEDTISAGQQFVAGVTRN